MEDSAELRLTECAQRFRSLNAQLVRASHTVYSMTRATAVQAWKFGGILNEIHGLLGAGGEPIPREAMERYCKELGLGTRKTKEGRPTGSSSVTKMRRLAAQVETEADLIALIKEYGNWPDLVDRALASGKTGEEVRAGRAQSRQKDARLRAQGRASVPLHASNIPDDVVREASEAGYNARNLSYRIWEKIGFAGMLELARQLKIVDGDR